MKNLILSSVLLLLSSFVFSQDKASAVKASEKAVAKDGVISSFEATLADGKLCLLRKLTANASGSFEKTYIIRNKVNAGFNQGRAYEITLDKASFDNYFQKSSPELAQKLPLLIKYAQDNKLSFSEEQTWARVIAYFNSLE